MDGKRLFRSLVIGLIVTGCVAAKTLAAPPWNALLAGKQVEADPAKAYTLTKQNGPWTILACSFSGPEAEKQAHELALELRQRYKLEAYTHTMKFDFGDTQGRGVDAYGAPRRMVPMKGRELSEVAVMVGNYPAADDADAQKILQKLKYTTPNCLDVKSGKATSQSLAGWRMTQKQALEWIGKEKKKLGQEWSGSEKQKLGPMGHALVSINPLLPKEQFVSAQVVDQFELEMNKDAKYSLLDCPGRYTLQVATFKGQVSIEQNEIREIEGGKHVNSTLADAALQAHVLTEALRLKGYEAYEFHGRYASIVTVGSFDSMGTPRADGKTEINPAIYKSMGIFKGKPISNVVGMPGGAMKPEKMGPFPEVGIKSELFFDIQPMPVAVPRRSISAAYSRNATLR